MNRAGRIGLLAIALAGAAGIAWSACTATFTGDDKGTFGQTLKYDLETQVLTVDLSGLGKDATIFRAELMLNPLRQGGSLPFKPTMVYPLGRPDKKLKFVAPRFVSLDAVEAVRAAVKTGKPFQMKVETTAGDIKHLEVSYSEGKPKATNIPLATNLKVVHRRGQSLVVFSEPKLEDFPEFKTGEDVSKFISEFQKKHPGMRLRIWRSAEKLTAKTIAKAKLVGEAGFFSCWNSAYHQDDTQKCSPIRYRVEDGGEPVPWGTGIYAHNPKEVGKAYYAVTVAVNGEEDFSTLGAGNTTAEPVSETVGLGEPILQWIERIAKGQQWLYRDGPLTRLIYARWESWPHSSYPNNPIDYLVVMADEPAPPALPSGSEYRCFRVEPAPVGLHLHCWGGSLNGGYGWWHNAHRGAVLIASNQMPYDWWTGYHEASGTCKTFGDGHVQPFTMNRLLGFLDWATTQWKEAPEIVRKDWRKLDLTRVFAAGTSMGGSGAPMFAVRYSDRIAWGLGWVGVHVPELSPQFKGSYQLCYGDKNEALTMPDGKTSPWDYFSDAWWLKNNVKAETGFIIASNGRDDGGIGWKQAYLFARALQETRRPHLYNWGMGGHGVRTGIGGNFDLDVRTDQTLPAFSNCTLDGDIGDGDPSTGDPEGAYNYNLWWETEDIVDTEYVWEMTVILVKSAPQDSCKVDLTPRRLQKFRTPKGAKFAYTVTDLQTQKTLAKGEAVADEHDLLTCKQIPLARGRNRVKLAAAGFTTDK